MHGPNGIGLKGLLFAPGDGLARLGLPEVRSVEEGVETSVSRDGEVVVPVLCNGGCEATSRHVDGADRLVT